ncbi:MAG: AAA family ATPase [Dethiobacter sp.]|jgi:transcriptional regulator with PAS, ATPase and Fis domain|nr:MAG: AAA family ATPase [Dethiobacter sp.]
MNFQDKIETVFRKRLGDVGKAILDSSPEGVLFADIKGNILYANSSYSNICCRKGEERVSKNIFVTNSNGALAEVLKTGKPVFGKKHRPPDSAVEVISNAFPIFINQEMIGGVVFFREASETFQLLEDLAQKEKKIEILASKLSDIAKAEYSFDSLIGESKTFLRALSLARKAACTDSVVLLRGESGTGKELFAHSIHNASSRVSYPFIKVNCAAIPENLLESEFFGYEKGAFTGANNRKLGTFELADRGTIFLDEIGDMDLRLQAKLLQVLQNREFRRVGGTDTQKVDVRIITATNRDLEEHIDAGRFRKDLYYRLNVVEINIPPLRERKDDIPVLAQKLLGKICRKLGRKIPEITRGAIEILENYNWPGNVRELENVIERAVNLIEDTYIASEDILLPRYRQEEKEDVIQPLENWENVMIKRALKKFGTSFEGKRKAAQALNISVTTLYNKIKKCNDFEDISPYRYIKS